MTKDEYALVRQARKQQKEKQHATLFLLESAEVRGIIDRVLATHEFKNGLEKEIIADHECNYAIDDYNVDNLIFRYFMHFADLRTFSSIWLKCEWNKRRNKMSFVFTTSYSAAGHTRTYECTGVEKFEERLLYCISRLETYAKDGFK